MLSQYRLINEDSLADQPTAQEKALILQAERLSVTDPILNHQSPSVKICSPATQTPRNSGG